MKRILILSTLLCTTLTLFGQDLQYSQYYASPLYLNPAFAGGSLRPRVSANYRMQWPSANLTPTGTSFSADYHINQLNSGIGLLVNLNKYNEILRNNEIGLLYSYAIKITEEMNFRLGVQGSYANRSLNFDRLLFPDQIVNNNQPTQEQEKYLPVKYIDFSGGMLAYSNRYWFGLSLHHLNRPNQSFYKSKNEFAPLPIKFSLHGGYNIVLDEYSYKNEKPSRYLTPTFYYKRQGNFEQFDIGSYFTYSPLVLGVWYRGVPIKKDVSKRIKNESLGFIIGYSQSDISVGYSFDITISGLRPTGGAHEVTLNYRFEPFETKRRRGHNRVEVAIPEF